MSRSTCHVGAQNWGSSLSYRDVGVAQPVRKLAPDPGWRGPFSHVYLTGPRGGMAMALSSRIGSLGQVIPEAIV